MKTIQLTQDFEAIVDNENFEWLNQWKWCYSKGYAFRIVQKDNKRTNIFMHRLIMNTPSSMEVDHINHNKLDNRKKNLRNCTSQQNDFNRLPLRNKKGKYKGVYWSKSKKKWAAKIKINGKLINLGEFRDEEDAYKRRIVAEGFYFI